MTLRQNQFGRRRRRIPTRAIGFSVWPRSEICCGPPRPRSPRSTRRRRRAHRRRRPVLDVREPDEYDQRPRRRRAHPRGHLESQVENKLTDKSAPVVVYCAGGTLGVRRPHAAGARLPPTSSRWTAVRTVEGRGPPVDAAGRAHARPAQPLHAPPAAPEVGTEGQAKLLGEGPPARRRRPRLARRAATSPRPASARSASSTWTRSTPRTCSARSSTTSIASATARSTRRRRR